MDRYELRRLDYSLSEDHLAIQEAYKQFFKTHCPIETVRAAEESGFDKSLWERLCAMGATTMALPESAGGDGATLVDLTLVAEEIGRSLAPVPWIDHVVRGAAAGTAGCAGLRPRQRQAAGRTRSAARERVGGSADPDRLDRRPDPGARRRRRRALTFGTRPVKVDNIGKLPMAWVDPAAADSRTVRGQRRRGVGGIPTGAG